MKLPPLFSHSTGNTWKGFTTLFCAFGSWWQSVKSLLSTLYNVCGLQFLQSFQPKTGCFCFTVPELPRLYNLVILSPDNFKRVFMRYWILNRNQWDISIHQRLEKLRAFAHIFPKVTLFKPTNTRVTEARARRMSNHHIPSVIQDLQNIALYMPLRMTTRTILNIRTICLMPALTKSYTDGLTFFTRYQYFHRAILQQNKRGKISASLQFERGTQWLF